MELVLSLLVHDYNHYDLSTSESVQEPGVQKAFSFRKRTKERLERDERFGARAGREGQCAQCGSVPTQTARASFAIQRETWRNSKRNSSAQVPISAARVQLPKLPELSKWSNPSLPPCLKTNSGWRGHNAMVLGQWARISHVGGLTLGADRC